MRKLRALYSDNFYISIDSVKVIIVGISFIILIILPATISSMEVRPIMSARSGWTYFQRFIPQDPFFAWMYPFTVYSPKLPLSFPAPSPWHLPYSRSSFFFNRQDPVIPWNRPAYGQLPPGELPKNLPGFEFYFFATPPIAYTPIRNISDPFSSPPSAPVGIESPEIKYKPIKYTPPALSPAEKYLRSQPAYVTGQVLVTFWPGTPPIEMNRVYTVHQCRLLYNSPYAGFKILGIPSYVTVKQMAQRLSLEPAVQYATPNYYRHAHLIPNDPYYYLQWHLPRLNCSYAWDYSTGTDVVVAILDSGVAYRTADGYAQAPDLGGTLFVPGYDFFNNDPYPDDDDGHGTHLAGCIAQTTNNLLGVAGVAFNAAIMPLKIGDSTGNLNSAQCDAIYYAVNNGVDIINMSFGGPETNEIEQAIISHAYISGVTMVCSAGNDTSDLPHYPSSYPECISVSAIRYDYSLAPYSNYGPDINVCAPGGDTSVDQNLDGTYDGILQQTHDGIDYTTFSYYAWQGTSFSCALTSGVAALIVSKSTVPLSPAEVTGILEGSATDLGDPGWDQYFGHGLVNAYLAVLQTP